MDKCAIGRLHRRVQNYRRRVNKLASRESLLGRKGKERLSVAREKLAKALEEWKASQ